ncbi:hypothetical protein M885DRAFT_455349 [Pelagophyceae sp. CCMP2097]|nr:hypothetical protein M885DRAFT_455349 [Pelagophyceae sp. CCMP2097]
MELMLEKQELLQVGTMSCYNTMKLFSAGGKVRQKIVLGSDGGEVECYEVKRGEPQLVFKQRVFADGPVHALSVGGVGGKNDRIFAAQGQHIVGLQRKGKQFFKMQSTLVEAIHHMHVDEQHLFTGCEYVYNKYNDGKDEEFVMCSDRINAMVVGRAPARGDAQAHDVILGCQDRCVRIVRGSEVVVEHKTDAPVTALQRYKRAKGEAEGADMTIVYGMENGAIGMMRATGSSAVTLWTVADARRSRVNCIDVYDMTRDGVCDVVVGRADGRVEVFSFDSATVPSKHFEADVGEAVHAVECGSLTHPNFDEIVCCTFSGRVVSFSNEPLAETKDADDAKGRSLAVTTLETRHKSLTNDVTLLQQRIEKERSRLRVLEGARRQQGLQPAPQLARPAYAPRAHFALDADAACYVITVELPVPIDVVALKASVRVELVDADHNASVVSRSPVEPRHASQKAPVALLATFRCLDEASALSFKVRTVEGEPGELVAVVVSRTAPKAAQMVRFSVKALSLHQRTHELDLAHRPINILRLRGKFSAQMLHDWLARCLPEVPPRAQPLHSEPSEAENVESKGQGEAVLGHRLSFRNVYTDAVLECDYADGEARIKSDSISTIAILKEHLSREAVRGRVEVHDALEINEETVPHFLGLLDRKLRHQLKLARQVKLIDSITEITSSEADTCWLSAEYREIADNADRIRQEFKEAPTELQYLTGVVTDFFCDRCKFCGLEARPKIPDLQRILMDYDFDTLVNFFDPARHRS